MSSVVKAFVSEGALLKIVVKVMDDSVIELLSGLGFVAVSNEERRILSLMATDEEVKIKIFEKLRDEGVCFAAGPGWCPADVFEFLRDQKLLTGVYRKIIWLGPKDLKIIENC